MTDFPETAQGNVVKVPKGSTEEQNDLQKGFTHPNLHRRIESKEDRKVHYGEVDSRDYDIMVSGVHSYKTVTYNVHDEESIHDETP